MDSDLKRMMSPSLSLVTIASLTPEKYDVIIEDENIRGIDFDSKCDLVGINVNVDTFTRASEISYQFRKRGTKVVFGGIHASSNPKEMHHHCDSVLIGEAEGVWEKLLDDFDKSRLKSIYQNNSGTNLSEFPIPKWSYADTSKYLYHNIIVTSRGCPFKCDFCYNSGKYARRKYRNRPIDDVIFEISQMKTKQVLIIDDNFIGNPKWTKEFIERIKPMGLTWSAAVSTDMVYHKDLIDDFAESGCKSLFIGFESINEKSIQSVGKRQNKISKYEELIKLLHDRNIMVNASLVFGFDNDDKSVFKNTLNWLIKNKIETMTSHILTPYPGTKLYERLEKEGRIIDNDLTHYNTSNVVFQPKNMTPRELRSGYLQMYKDFYSFKNIMKRLPVKPTAVKPFLLFNFGYRKFGKITAFIGRLGFMDKIGYLSRKLSYGIG